MASHTYGYALYDGYAVLAIGVRDDAEWHLDFCTSPAVFTLKKDAKQYIKDRKPDMKKNNVRAYRIVPILRYNIRVDTKE